MPYVGILQAAGLKKESVLGTLATPPTEFLPLIAPDSFSEAITLLESKGIRAQPDAIVKVLQGPADLKSGKIKIEAEPENIGNQLMATFGTDTLAETASFVITLNTNDRIDFKEDAGAQRNAQIVAGTYVMGTSSAQNGTLCKAVKTALEAAPSAGGTYTVTYSYSTKKMTITQGGAKTTVQILWLTGTNQAMGAYTVLGWSHTDTANSAAVTSDSTTAVAVQTHTFTRASVAQLPTYSWWFHKGAKYFQFTGCMLSKLILDVKANQFVTLDADYVALTYDDTGSSQTPSYSALKPFSFNQAVIKVAGSQVNDFDNVQITVDNMVEADHALSASIYPNKIYSKGMRVTVTMDLFLEDTVEWNRFLAGTSTSLEIILTSGELISTSNAYKLDIVIPVINYTAAPLLIQPGVLKIQFAAVAVYDVSTTKTMSIALNNTVATAY